VAKKREQVKLVPVDPDRCQTEHLGGSFMTLGPRTMTRCENEAIYIANEKKPGEDGVVGAMSLCEDCLERFHKALGKDFAVISKIIKEVKNDV